MPILFVIYYSHICHNCRIKCNKRDTVKLLNELSDHLYGLNVEWYICGGFAIDAYLGNITGNHKDVDITVSFDNM